MPQSSHNVLRVRGPLDLVEAVHLRAGKSVVTIQADGCFNGEIGNQGNTPQNTGEDEGGVEEKEEGGEERRREKRKRKWKGHSPQPDQGTYKSW
jgi:hypothetical protein